MKIKRRRYTLINLFTYFSVFFICLGLIKSAKKRIKLKFEPPDYECYFSKLPAVNSSTTKTVVLWTQFNGDSQWQQIFDVKSNNMAVSTDDGRTCRFSLDRSDESVQAASALIFHARDIDFSAFPLYRCPWQRWVFFSLDPPISNGLDGDHWEMSNDALFNLSMTYATTADVTWPLGQILPSNTISFDSNLEREANDKIESLVETFQSKTRQALWIATKCLTPGGRENLVQKLKDRGVEVDIFGGCLNSSKSQVDFSKYRFYFAFEDAFCDHYVNEAFTAMKLNLKYGIIPVVYSGAKLQNYLPPGSYIDASNFSNVDNVVAQLKKLGSAGITQAEVASFYSWHRSYKIPDESMDRLGLKSLCNKLWALDNNDKQRSVSFHSLTDNDLHLSWGKCYQPGFPNIVQSFFF